MQSVSMRALVLIRISDLLLKKYKALQLINPINKALILSEKRHTINVEWYECIRRR